MREQIGELTGRRFLTGHASDEDQYRALLEAGATVASEWGLRPGVALPAEQMAPAIRPKRMLKFKARKGRGSKPQQKTARKRA